MFLLDTNVVSEMRRPRPNPRVAAWLAAQPSDQLKVSAVTFGEIQTGIELLRGRDKQKAEMIEAWAAGLAATSNVLVADVAIFRRHVILVQGKSSAHDVDALIAATALVHDLTVATRNIADFSGFGVRLFDPFAA